MRVLKFGGTSVKTAQAMMQAADIVAAQRDTPLLVVLSACGGITDKLLAAATAAANSEHETRESVLSDIHRHHMNVCHELLAAGLFVTERIADVEDLLAELHSYCEGISLLCECTPQSYDAVASFGERLSTRIFTTILEQKKLNAVLLDARQVMKTNEVFMSATAERRMLRDAALSTIIPLMQSNHAVVTQGFIGSDAQGRTTTLGRGGSDLSAALFGAAIQASEIQIWTDVNGVLTTDPRLVPDALTIEEIGFAEVRQLAYFGAKVLHPDTIKPAIDNAIPVRILNTFEPAHKGTTVVLATEKTEPCIRAVSLLRSCALVREDVGVDEKATTKMASLVATAVEHHTEILLCFAEESSYGVVIRARDAHLFERSQRRISNTDVLCICGPALNTSRDIHTIGESLRQFQPLAILSGMSDVSVIALLDMSESVQALGAIHSHITHHQHSHELHSL